MYCRYISLSTRKSPGAHLPLGDTLSAPNSDSVTHNDLDMLLILG